MQFTLWDMLSNLLLAARWTLGLTLLAFACGGAAALALLALRVGPYRPGQVAAKLYIEAFQGTPLLMQLFLVFFGLPLLGVEVSPWLAAYGCRTSAE